MPSSGISLRQQRSQGQGQGQAPSPVDEAWAKASRRVEELGERMTSLLQVGERMVMSASQGAQGEERDTPCIGGGRGRESTGGESEGPQGPCSPSSSSLGPLPAPGRERHLPGAGRGPSGAAAASSPSDSHSFSHSHSHSHSQRDASGRHWFSGLRGPHKGEKEREKGRRREREGGTSESIGRSHTEATHSRDTGPEALSSAHSSLSSDHTSPSPTAALGRNLGSSIHIQGTQHAQRHTPGLRDRDSAWRCPLDVSVQQQCARTILQFAEAVADNTEILFLMHSLPSRARFLRQLQTYMTSAVAALSSLLDSSAPSVVWSAARASCLLSQGRLVDLWCAAAPVSILLPLACLLDNPSDQVVCDAAVAMTATLSKMRPATQSHFTLANSYSTKDHSAGTGVFPIPWNPGGSTNAASNSTSNNKGNSRNGESTSSTGSSSGATNSSGATSSSSSSSKSSGIDVSASRGRRRRAGEDGEGPSAREGRSTAELAQLVGRALGAPGAALPCPSSTPLVRLCPLSVQSSLWLGLDQESQMLLRILNRLKGLAGIEEVMIPVEEERKGLLWNSLPQSLRGKGGKVGSNSSISRSSSSGGSISRGISSSIGSSSRNGGGGASAPPAWSGAVTMQTMAVKTLRLLLSVTHIWREQARESFEAMLSDWMGAFKVLCTHRSCYISTAAMSSLCGALVCCPALGAALLEESSEGALWPGVVLHILQNKCPAAVAAAASLVARLVSLRAFCRVLRSADTSALAGALVPLMSASRCPAEISAHTVPSLSAPSSSLLASLSSFGCTHTGPTRATMVAYESFPFPPVPAATTSSSFSTNQAALQSVVGLLRWPGAHRRVLLMHSLAHTLHGKLAHGWQSAAGAKESGKEAGERRELIWSAVEWLARFSGNQQCLDDGTLATPSPSSGKRPKPHRSKAKALGTPASGAPGTTGAPAVQGLSGKACSLIACGAHGKQPPDSRTPSGPEARCREGGFEVEGGSVSGCCGGSARAESNWAGAGCMESCTSGEARAVRSGAMSGKDGVTGEPLAGSKEGGGWATSEEGSGAPDLWEYSLTRLIDATCAAFLGLFCGHVPSASYALRAMNLRDNLRHAVSSHEGYCLARATLALVQAPDRAMAHTARTALQNLLLTSADGRLWKWHVPDVKGSASWQMQDSWEQAARLSAVAALAEVDGFREELVLLGLAGNAWEVAQEASPGKSEEETLERLLVDALVSPRSFDSLPTSTVRISPINPPTHSNPSSHSRPLGHGGVPNHSQGSSLNSSSSGLMTEGSTLSPGGSTLGTTGIPPPPNASAATFFASSVDMWEGKDKVLLAALQALESLLRAHHWCAAQGLVPPLPGAALRTVTQSSSVSLYSSEVPTQRPPSGGLSLRVQSQGAPTESSLLQGGPPSEGTTPPESGSVAGSHGQQQLGGGTRDAHRTEAAQNAAGIGPWLKAATWRTGGDTTGMGTGIGAGVGTGTGAERGAGIGAGLGASGLPVAAPVQGLTELAWHLREGESGPPPGVRWCAAMCLANFGVYGLTSPVCSALLPYSPGPAGGADDTFADVVFSFHDGQRLPAHGAVVAARCPELLPKSLQTNSRTGRPDKGQNGGVGGACGSEQSIGEGLAAEDSKSGTGGESTAERSKGSCCGGVSEEEARALFVPKEERGPLVVPMSGEVDSAAFGAVMDFVYTGAAHLAPGLEPAVARLASRCRLPVLASLVLHEPPSWGAPLPVCNLSGAIQHRGTLWSDYGLMCAVSSTWGAPQEGEGTEDCDGDAARDCHDGDKPSDGRASEGGMAACGRHKAGAEGGGTAIADACEETEEGNAALGEPRAAESAPPTAAVAAVAAPSTSEAVVHPPPAAAAAVAEDGREVIGEPCVGSAQTAETCETSASATVETCLEGVEIGAEGTEAKGGAGEVGGPLQGVRPVHRVVLAARCEYLRGLLCSGMRESSTHGLTLPLPQPAVSGLVAYLYMGSGAVRQAMLTAVLQEQERHQCVTGTPGARAVHGDQQHQAGARQGACVSLMGSKSLHSVSAGGPLPSLKRLNPTEALTVTAQAQAQSHIPSHHREDAMGALILSAVALAGTAQQWMLPGLLHECASIVFETVSMETAVEAVQAAWDESVGIIVEGLAALLAPHYLKLQYSGKLASVHDQLADLLRATFVESKVL